MTFPVEVSQILIRTIDVEADNIQEAEDKAMEQFFSGEFELTMDDWCGVTEFGSMDPDW